MHHHYNSIPEDVKPASRLSERFQEDLKEIPGTVPGGGDAWLVVFWYIFSRFVSLNLVGRLDELNFLMHYYAGLLALIISMYFSKYSGSMYAQ